jgi:hypothetical protein
MSNSFRKKSKPDPDELKPFPAIGVINAIQFQLFDNGENPGRGRSQHQVKIEVYCDGRLDLLDPHWVRVVPLLDEKVFMKWVDSAWADDRITKEQHETYKSAHEIITAHSIDEDVEFAKLGHIGNKRKNEYYNGQFVAMTKYKNGGMWIFVFRDNENIHADSFIFDQNWVRGGPRRKFFGFYDPWGFYERAKAEKEFAAAAEAKAAERRQENHIPRL